MKIAVVGPSPVPYVYGGVEGLLWKLVESINKYTPHQAELIKLPLKELSFWDLIDSYYKFYTLDLLHFDMVISTKYPAWMVKHHNHVVYLQHHLRGLFDTYHFSNEPNNVPQDLRVGLVDSILNLISMDELSEKNVDRVFEELNQLKKEQDSYAKETFMFPGPFIREIIHFFDKYALSKEHIKTYFAISKNVKQREGYFPDDASIEVVYHPPKIENFQCKEYEYLFTVSRLDPPKRIDMLIGSMKYVPHNIKFKIAGIGPEEQKLKELAKNDPRIEFVGFVDEEELVNLYSNALAVLYIPYDEDYGLITIEAMKSRKPVITALDSGGPLEFVKNSKTGYSCKLDPKKIAEKINYLIKNSGDAKRMGDIAYQSVKDIDWEHTVRKLLKEENAEHCKKKILVLSTYSCYPPRGGGQHRLYNVYSTLAKNFDVTICSIVPLGNSYQDLILENGLKQICVPQNKKHVEAQWAMERKVGVDIYDVGMIDFIEESTDYVQKVKELVNESDIVIFSHPYLFGLNKFIGKKQRVIYEAHNVEFMLKKGFIKNADYVKKIKDIEQEACSKTDVVFVTSDEDKKDIIENYGADPKKIVVAPNGVDIRKIRLIDKKEKNKQKKSAGIYGRPTILFIGSWHYPNLEALEFINDLAKKLPNHLFLIIGSVKDYYLERHGNLQKNILAFGPVDEELKYEIYKLADIAINPMFTGSGTNIKMLDYMAAGIPVISTPIGARGLEIESYKHAIICPANQMLGEIVKLLSDERLQDDLRKNARELAEEKYSWERISRIMEERLER